MSFDTVENTCLVLARDARVSRATCAYLRDVSFLLVCKYKCGQQLDGKDVRSGCLRSLLSRKTKYVYAR